MIAFVLLIRTFLTNLTDAAGVGQAFQPDIFRSGVRLQNLTHYVRGEKYRLQFRGRI